MCVTNIHSRMSTHIKVTDQNLGKDKKIVRAKQPLDKTFLVQPVHPFFLPCRRTFDCLRPSAFKAMFAVGMPDDKKGRPSPK